MTTRVIAAEEGDDPNAPTNTETGKDTETTTTAEAGKETETKTTQETTETGKEKKEDEKPEPTAAELRAQRERETERAELEQLRKEKKEREDAAKTEAEKLKDEIEQLKKEKAAQAAAAVVKERETQLIDEARELGVVNPKLVVKLVDLDLTADDVSEAEIKAAVKELTEAEPYLLGSDDDNPSSLGRSPKNQETTSDESSASWLARQLKRN